MQCSKQTDQELVDLKRQVANLELQLEKKRLRERIKDLEDQLKTPVSEGIKINDEVTKALDDYLKFHKTAKDIDAPILYAVPCPVYPINPTNYDFYCRELLKVYC